MDKSVLLMDKIIYPDSLINCIRKFLRKKEFTPVLFSKGYVRVIVIFDENEERLNDVCKEIQQAFINSINGRTMLHLDDDELRLQLMTIVEQMSNGIPETVFIDWFTEMAFHCRQLSVPLDEYGQPKKEYNPKSVMQRHEITIGEGNPSKHFINYIFFCSDGSLAGDLTINELVKKIDIINYIRDKLKGKSDKTKKRKPLDSRLRHECFKRDNYTCKECGATREQKMLQADHIIPIAQGGTDELDNLQTLCDDCNQAKYNRAWKGGERELHLEVKEDAKE